MDGTSMEHSDSDSGESWTLLEASPAYADEVPEVAEICTEGAPVSGPTVESNEKDEDTDGISIISDSDPESLFPCDLNCNRCSLEEGHQEQNNQYFTINPLSPNDNHESLRSDDDFLGDNNGKHKTYVHRRNKRLSTVLNIIVLGSVITAAGVAIGHMWGVRNDCTMQTTPSVNKILSNLYKLQEENSYLRSKLKELSLLNNIQMKKTGSEKMLAKQNRCKKVFEASINNKNIDKYTKCVDAHNSPKILEPDPEYEKEFINEIDRLRLTYEQNKSWLDEETSKRIKHEKLLVKELKRNAKNLAQIFSENDIEKPLETISEFPTPPMETDSELPLNKSNNLENTDVNYSQLKKVSYADSLQSDYKAKNNEKREIRKYTENNRRDTHRRKLKKNKDIISEQLLSEDEFKKDDRYVGPKHKHEWKKLDRQKSHKKQKRKNKYEQWEMKGGYIKNYDDFSVTSQDSEFNTQTNAFINEDKTKMKENIENNNKISQNNDIIESTGVPLIVIENISDKYENKGPKDTSWYENRAVLRMEARKKLQQELFGDSSPNTAAWYFRRVQRREQCRVKNDNSTLKKNLRHKMNFKTKH